MYASQVLFLALSSLPFRANAWISGPIMPVPQTVVHAHDATRLDATSTGDDAIAFDTPSQKTSVIEDKAAILQVGAALDRGQAYNPTAGTYYQDRLEQAKHLIQQFIQVNPECIPKTTEGLVGEWELILTTCPKNGIYRSSPTFLAIQEAYETQGHQVLFGQNVTDVWIQLHERQAKTFKLNKIGRVAHYVTPTTVFSEFDTVLLNINAMVPIVGWFKFLPEVAGTLVTAMTITDFQANGTLELEIDYTTPRKVKGIWGKGGFDWRIPVAKLWKALPWNNGRPPAFRLFIRYSDNDFRIVQDLSGEYFVYTKPVLPRNLDLVDKLASQQ